MRARLYLLPVLMLSLGSCTSTTAPVDADGILFEIEYVNHAWIPTWHGVVIDTAGGVHAFDLEGQSWSGASEEYVTARELETKWSHRSEDRGTIPRTALADMIARVPAAAQGDLSAPVNRCADAGTVTYSAYRYDAGRHAFQRVVLRREGDIIQRHETAAGRALADWLISLELLARLEGCTDED